MRLLGPSLPIDDDEFEWLLACFAWIERTLGARDGGNGFVPNLVLPDEPGISQAKTAKDLFAFVKEACGLGEWPCRLEKGKPRREMIDTGLGAGALPEQSSALGTFSIEGNHPVIRYDPALLNNPEALTATFAHELSHLLIHSLGMPPGGEALEEHATDCMAVYLGFGVFLANSARNFSQFSDGAMHGWSSETSGYLSENALVTALAIFEARFGMGNNTGAHLKDYLRPIYRKAHRYLNKKHPDIGQRLAAIQLSDWV